MGESTNKLKLSYRRLVNFSAAAKTYIARKPNTKLAYALGRIIAQCDQIDVEMQERIASINVDFALTEPADDPNGRLLKDVNGNYEYTKEGTKKRNAAINDLLDKEQWEIDPHFVLEAPKGLSITELQHFSGLAIKPEDVETIRAAYESTCDAEQQPDYAN